MGLRRISSWGKLAEKRNGETCKGAVLMSGEKKLYECKELLKKYGGPLPMSAAGFYKACSEGKIATVRVGNRVFVPSWWVDKMLNEPTA